MGMFDTGSRHCFGIDDCCYTATIIYNNGKLAIGGTAYEVERESSYDNNWEHTPFALTAEEVKAFVPNMEDEDLHRSYIVVDLTDGHLVGIREWLRRNNALFIPGKEYHAPDEWNCCMGETMTVYRHNGTAIIKVYNGEGCVWDALKRVGHSMEEVCAAFPQFTDNYPTECKEFFYICIRESDDAYTDLEGNPVNDIVHALI